MLLNDFMNEAFYNFYLESEEIEEETEKSKEVAELAKKIAREIQEKMESKYDAKDKEKDVIFTLRIRKVNKDIAEGTVRFRTEHYPDYLEHEKEIRFEMELDQATAGVFAVDGVKMDELSKQALIGLSKEKDVKLELKQEVLNLRGKLYVKIAAVAIPVVALTALVAYGVGKNTGLKEAADKLKHGISENADKIADKTKELGEATAKEIGKAKTVIIENVHEIYEKISGLGVGGIIAAIIFGIVATIGVVMYITRLKKTKKEHYELAMLIENYESYEIVKNIIIKEDTNYGGLVIPGPNMDKVSSGLNIPGPKMDKVPSKDVMNKYINSHIQKSNIQNSNIQNSHIQNSHIQNSHNISIFDKVKDDIINAFDRFKEFLHHIVQFFTSHSLNTGLIRLHISNEAAGIIGLLFVGLTFLSIAVMVFKDYTITTKELFKGFIGSIIFLISIPYLYFSFISGSYIPITAFLHTYFSVIPALDFVFASIGIAVIFSILYKVIGDLRNAKAPSAVRLSADSADRDYMKLISR